MKEIFIVEHRWQADSWKETRPVYREVEEALRIAERMAEMVPQRSKFRVGYEARVRTVDGKVIGSFRGDAEEGFGHSQIVAFDGAGGLKDKLAALAERDGVSVGEEARDIVSVAVGVFPGRDPAEESF